MNEKSIMAFGWKYDNSEMDFDEQLEALIGDEEEDDGMTEQEARAILAEMAI